jgi:hypothetical protein
VASGSDPGPKLKQLILMQAEAAAQMRSYIPFFFGGDRLPPDLSMKWRNRNRHFEKEWAGVVGACMDGGYPDRSDALVTTRLILGMTMWSVARCELTERISAKQVADSVVRLLRLEPFSS